MASTRPTKPQGKITLPPMASPHGDPNSPQGTSYQGRRLNHLNGLFGFRALLPPPPDPSRTPAVLGNLPIPSSLHSPPRLRGGDLGPVVRLYGDYERLASNLLRASPPLVWEKSREWSSKGTETVFTKGCPTRSMRVHSVTTLSFSNSPQGPSPSGRAYF